MPSLKYSRQREAVLNFLMGRKDHPTADVVYENVKQAFPNISLGTVYRNLNLLSELGQIRKISSFEGADHFDARTDLHCHFFCQCCHGVSDMDQLDPEPILREASRGFAGSIQAFSGRFTGICPRCRAEGKEPPVS